LKDQSSFNFAILLRRYLMSRSGYAVLLRFGETLPGFARIANHALFKLDRLTARVFKRPHDHLFLQFCSEVELCAMAGLVEIKKDSDLVRTIASSLLNQHFRSRRDVLPALLYRRLLGQGFTFASPDAGAFVADLLVLSDEVSVRSNVWFFLAHPQDAAAVLSRPVELSDFLVECEDRVVTGSDRAILGFLSLLEFLQDFFELIEAADDPYLQSALWHLHADLLDRASVIYLEGLSTLLEDQKAVDKAAVEAARTCLHHLRQPGEWEAVLMTLRTSQTSGELVEG
jgi:hypothetical protein